MQALARLNREFRERHELNTNIAARIDSYELAARMQLSAPGVVDLSKEPQHILDLYGVGEKPTDDFGRQLLMARRLVENGVRFVQICHAGGGNGSWDAHGDMKTHEPLCRAVDKPIAGLIQDLKQRGMLRAHSGRIYERVRSQPMVAKYDRPRSQSEGLQLLVCGRRHQGWHSPRSDGRVRLQSRREPALLQ